jgi:cation diffusion facilitator family transporter
LENTFTSVKKVLLIILVLNLLVVAAKMVVGLISSSLSMVADSFHSLLDSSSNVVGLIGIKLAEKQPDKDHPYGHAKYESLATVFIAFLLLITGIQIFQGSIERVSNPILPSLTYINWIVMISTILINIGVTLYERKKGMELKSEILIADASHTYSDIFVSLSVILSFILISLGFAFFDIIISVFIAIFIFIVGFRILKSISKILIDTYVIDPMIIEQIISTISGVKGVHKIRSRGTSNNIFIDLHFTVDKNLSIKKAHDISILIENKIKEELPACREVITHIEPE